MTLLLYVYSFGWLPNVPRLILITAGLIGWLTLSVAVGSWVSRMIWTRDRQVPAALSDRPLRWDDQGGTL